MDSEVSNYEWICNAIHTAMTKERLDLLCQEIKMDKEACADYTLDEMQINKLRELVQVKYQMICEKTAVG
jgi:hypothetical protein